MKRLKYSRIGIAGFTAAVLLGSALIFSPVKAYFHQTAEQEMDIQMGTWWDGSRLAFTGTSQNREDTCSPVRLTFTIENTGFAMIGPSTFRIFKDGERMEEGSLGEITANGEGTISVTVQSPGTYHAEADQRPGYEGSATPVSTSSGNTALAECPPPKEEKEKKEKKPADKKDEAKSKTKKQDEKSDKAVSKDAAKAEEDGDTEKAADVKQQEDEKDVLTEEKER